MKKFIIKKYINDHINSLNNTLGDLETKIPKAFFLINNALKKNKKIIVFGNGGSASDSLHFSAELSGKYKSSRRKPLPCISLTENAASLTAIGNDFGYDKVFSRQIQSYAQKDDVAIGISTSGKSVNVLKAIQVAKKMGLKTIFLTGKNKLKSKNKCNVCINVQSLNTATIQEIHIMILHMICELIEENYN
tara:strand:- start:227 stop:799 length:573 start_codon:yes stop_codon:yes gene_type:complete